MENDCLLTDQIQNNSSHDCVNRSSHRPTAPSVACSSHLKPGPPHVWSSCSAGILRSDPFDWFIINYALKLVHLQRLTTSPRAMGPRLPRKPSNKNAGIYTSSYSHLMPSILRNSSGSILGSVSRAGSPSTVSSFSRKKGATRFRPRLSTQLSRHRP